MAGQKPNGVIAPTAIDHDATSKVQSFFATHPDVRFVRYYVQDYCGQLRVRHTTSARALQLAANRNDGIKTGSPIICVGQQSGQTLIEMFQLGDDVWLPDWSSLREFPASPGTATVMCSVEEHNKEAEGKDAMMASCPRSILERVVRDAKTKHDVDFLIGFEIEFYLVANPNATETLPSTTGVWVSSSLRDDHWTDIVEECVTILETAGVRVWGFCQEGSHAKYEISLSPLSPVDAVDALHFTHETIKTIAKKRGCHATMHAKAFADGPTAGKHIHLSLSRSELGESFLAGVLKHFRPLCALMLSSVESYQRSMQFGSGAVCWGWGNKITCMKRIEDAYFEIRPPDSFGNMFLILAGIIGVGMKGVDDKEEVTSKSFSKVMLGTPPDEETRKEFNITEDVPANLGESIKEFKKDELLKEILGQACFDRYVLNKEKDLEGCNKMSSTERRKVLLAEY